MEVMTIQKYIHTSPRKLRLVADMIRKMNPNKALGVLTLTPKAAAKEIHRALNTVLASAKQQGLDIEKVSFKSVEINESTKMRRFKAGTRGRAKPFKRRMSHIKIVLSDNQVQKEDLKNEKEKGGKQTKVVVDNSAESVEQKSKETSRISPK